MTDTHGRRGGGREAVVEDERLVVIEPDPLHPTGIR